MRGQAHWPMPPWAAASTTGMVRTSWSLVSVVHRRYSPQAVTKLTMITTTRPFLTTGSRPPRTAHEIDDGHRAQGVPDERQADHPERAPDAGAVDVGGVHELVRHELEHA